MSRLRDDPLEHGFAHAILGEQRVGDLSRPQRLTWRRGVCMGQGGASLRDFTDLESLACDGVSGKRCYRQAL